MPEVRIRPYREEDAAAIDAAEQEAGAFEFYRFRATNAFRSRYARDGMLSEDHGNLAIVLEGTGFIGDIGWFAVHHGPGSIARALNIGIYLFPDHRGRGYGTQAQRLLADHLFATTLIERLEASTDVDNIAEQRALTKAGYSREGVLRHAQFRDGAWRDLVLFSRLRGDA